MADDPVLSILFQPTAAKCKKVSNLVDLLLAPYAYGWVPSQDKNNDSAKPRLNYWPIELRTKYIMVVLVY